MDYKELFEGVRNRTGMYLMNPTYQEADAFVGGCDAGNEWCLLLGFREWLIVRTSWGSNMSWTRLVLRVAFPEEDDPQELLKHCSDAQHRHAINVLFDLLKEFFEARSGIGIQRIFESHSAWVRKRDQEIDEELENEEDDLEDQEGPPRDQDAQKVA